MLSIFGGGVPLVSAESRITLFQHNMCSRILGPIHSCRGPVNEFNRYQLWRGGVC